MTNFFFKTHDMLFFSRKKPQNFHVLKSLVSAIACLERKAVEPQQHLFGSVPKFHGQVVLSLLHGGDRFSERDTLLHSTCDILSRFSGQYRIIGFQKMKIQFFSVKDMHCPRVLAFLVSPRVINVLLKLVTSCYFLRKKN